MPRKRKETAKDREYAWREKQLEILIEKLLDSGMSHKEIRELVTKKVL